MSMWWNLGCWLTLAALMACAGGAQARVPPASALRELSPVQDGGFEQGAGPGPGPAWTWSVPGDTRPTAVRDEAVKHSGRRSLRVTNGGGSAPQVYGLLEQEVPVVPETTYLLSVWVKGEQVGDDNHFADWDHYWVDIPAGSYDWQRLQKRLRTGAGQRQLKVRLELSTRIGALWVDDLRLEAEITPLQGEGVIAAFWAPELVEGDNVEAKARVLAAVTPGFGGRAELAVLAGGREIGSCSGALPGGRRSLELSWSSGQEPAERLELRLQVKDGAGRVVAAAAREVRKFSSALALEKLARVKQALPALRRQLQALAGRGVAVDYPLVSLTNLEHFAAWSREDVARAEVRRACYAADDLLAMLARAQQEAAALQADPTQAPRVVRYRTSKIEIKGSVFHADTAASDGSRGRGPVFFTGYGHFGQVVDDLEVFPDYGVNVIQIELGPNSVLTSEHEVSYDRIRQVQAALERAAKANVSVCLLLSPHYFPGWALEKWPHLRACRGGFLGYCVDAPEARAVIERYLRILIPQLRGRPGLHSLCLSNEPIWDDTANCPITRRQWAQWLAREHGEVAALNRRLGTSYPSFEQVPIPGNREFAAPQYGEWVLFNNERFAGFHRFMADIIHELAPEIPVHAKVMAWTLNGRWFSAYGLDAELFAELGQIGGNDCSESYPGQGEWAMGWQLQNWCYDLQRTLRDQPVFNTENHLTPDRSSHYVPGSYFRTALWQGAVHGQGATTIWVWERTYDRKSDFYGNVMHRPSCAEEVGRTGLDLLRLAPQVASLQQAPSPVAFLYSVVAGAKSELYFPLMASLYEAANFTGVPISFVSDHMAARGEFGSARLLILPAATHLPEDAFGGIARWRAAGGKLLLVGEDNLRYDRFGQERATDQVRAVTAGAEVLPAELDQAARHQVLAGLMERLGFIPALRLQDRQGRVPWGVEFRVGTVEGRSVLNAVNYLARPQQVRLVADGRPVPARDLISGKLVGRQLTLAPLQPVLLAPEHQ